MKDKNNEDMYIEMHGGLKIGSLIHTYKERHIYPYIQGETYI